MSITKDNIISLNTFKHLRNPAAGPGQVLPTVLIENMLPGAKFIEVDLVTQNNEILPHVVNIKSQIDFEVDDLKEIIGYVDIGDLINQKLKKPTFFTFYLALIKKVKQVIACVTFPLDDNSSPGKTIDVYFDISTNNAPDPAPDPDQQTLGADAGDDAVCRGIAVAHSIRPETFLTFLTAFWGEMTVPPPYLISWDVLHDLLVDNSDAERVKMVWKEDDTSNNDMDFSFETEDEKRFVWIKTHYSTNLFWGIDLVNPAGELRFYKGKSDDQSPTILIENVGQNGVHQFFDLSNEQP